MNKPFKQKKDGCLSKSENSLTIEYHWREFRFRLIYLFSSTVITFALCFYFSPQLVYLFVRPCLSLNREFIFTDLTEAFFIALSVCQQLTLTFVFFVALYQLGCFFIPSCVDGERKRIVVFLKSLCFSLLTTFCLVYFIFLPKFCKFFFNYSIKSTSFTLELQAKIESYIILFSRVFIVFIVILFVFFVLYLWLSHLANFRVDFFQKVCDKRPQIFLLLFLISALISPPDPWSQSLIAFFLFLLFEAVIWLALFSKKF